MKNTLSRCTTISSFASQNVANSLKITSFCGHTCWMTAKRFLWFALCVNMRFTVLRSNNMTAYKLYCRRTNNQQYWPINTLVKRAIKFANLAILLICHWVVHWLHATFAKQRPYRQMVTSIVVIRLQLQPVSIVHPNEADFLFKPALNLRK